jgi:hypothetical protein
MPIFTLNTYNVHKQAQPYGLPESLFNNIVVMVACIVYSNKKKSPYTA